VRTFKRGGAETDKAAGTKPSVSPLTADRADLDARGRVADGADESGTATSGEQRPAVDGRSVREVSFDGRLSTRGRRMTITVHLTQEQAR
jgi:hypothetical protein